MGLPRSISGRLHIRFDIKVALWGRRQRVQLGLNLGTSPSNWYAFLWSLVPGG